MSYFFTILLYAIAAINLAAAVTYEGTSKRFSSLILGLIIIAAAIWCNVNVWGM